MPVGKPDPDGEIIKGSRHYSGRPQPLGSLAVWNCPACGVQNEGRVLEQGCAHCGAGDQSKSRAGSQQVHEPVAAPMRPLPDAPRRVPEPHTGRAGNAEERPSVDAPLRILRLIEYLIHPGQNADTTLRRSLVGRMELAWGSITATIVDSIDSRQEDLLRLAHRQPGVWIANPEAMHGAGSHPLPPGVITKAEGDRRALEYFEEKFRQSLRENTPMAEEDLTPPDTGPSYTPVHAMWAKLILDQCGARIANTIALALSAIAEELAGNMEPEKFLSREECLQLANALIHQLPEDWQGDQPVPEEVPQP